MYANFEPPGVPDTTRASLAKLLPEIVKRIARGDAPVADYDDMVVHDPLKVRVCEEPRRLFRKSLTPF